MRAFRISLLMLSLVLALFASAAPAQAWGKFGHLTVCDLAYRNLTEASRTELKRLFHEPTGISVTGRDGVERRHYTSFNVGCLEEDEVPRKHPDDHFINVARDVLTIDAPVCPSQLSCVFEGIDRDLAILKDTTKSDEERVFALMAVGHWVGDIHQPLHVSFADDRGGNYVLAHLSGHCGSSNYRVTNLHGMWDNCLLEAGLFERVRKRADFKTSWGPRTITYRAVDTLQANTTLSAEKALVGTETWKWAAESYVVTRDPNVRYCVMVDAKCQYDLARPTLPANTPELDRRKQELGQDYLDLFERIAEDRVAKAGFRLAHLLNLALDPAYTGPVQNSTQRP